jgi:hypothetical protein
VLIHGHHDVKVRTRSKLDVSGGMRTSVTDEMVEKFRPQKTIGRMVFRKVFAACVKVRCGAISRTTSMASRDVRPSLPRP